MQNVVQNVAFVADLSNLKLHFYLAFVVANARSQSIN